DAELADAPDFMPRRGHEDAVRRIEALALEETVTIVRRARTAGSPMRLHAPLTRATIGDPRAVEMLLATLEANRAIAGSLAFAMTQAEWKQVMPSEKVALAQMNREGIGFSMLEASSLRFDFGELEGLGF